MFVHAGLRTDFLDRLSAASDALNTSLINRGNTACNHEAAAQALDAETTHGREAVNVLSALIDP